MIGSPYMKAKVNNKNVYCNSFFRPEDAIPDFESVLKLNKEIAAAHVNLGLIYMTKHMNFHRSEYVAVKFKIFAWFNFSIFFSKPRRLELIFGSHCVFLFFV